MRSYLIITRDGLRLYASGHSTDDAVVATGFNRYTVVAVVELGCEWMVPAPLTNVIVRQTQ